MNLMKYLIFIYDMTSNISAFELQEKCFLVVKKSSPPFQSQLGTSKIQIQPRIWETHQKNQGLLDLLFLTHSSVFPLLFADLFL